MGARSDVVVVRFLFDTLLNLDFAEQLLQRLVQSLDLALHVAVVVEEVLDDVLKLGFFKQLVH